MKKNITRICFVVISVCCFFLSDAIAQTIKTSNIHYRIIDEKIEIYYDLPVNHDTLSVSVIFLKKSDPEFKYWPKYIKGDLGKGVFSGKDKKITWAYKKEPEYLFTGSEFYFKVFAKKIPEKQFVNPDTSPGTKNLH